MPFAESNYGKIVIKAPPPMDDEDWKLFLSRVYWVCREAIFDSREQHKAVADIMYRDAQYLAEDSKRILRSLGIPKP